MRKRTSRAPQRVKFSLPVFQAAVEADLQDFCPVGPHTKAIYEAGSLQSLNPHQLFVCRQLEALTKKNVNAPGSDATRRRKAAESILDECESHCRYVNSTLRKAFNRLPLSSVVRSVFAEAQLWIQDCLGELSTQDFTTIYEEASFGPGMTFGCQSKRDASPVFKIGGPQTLTQSALPYLEGFLVTCPPIGVQLCQDLNLVLGNRVTFVPKTADVMRPIAIEPSINVLLQKGVDTLMRKRLARKGVDLTNQTVGHPLAKAGSQGDFWATVDLASASDTVSIALVKLMLPGDWFRLLDDLRSHWFTSDKGKTWQCSARFSSMGNATTFPLESLLFKAFCYGVARAVGERDRSVVYGDDIVIPSNLYALLVEVLMFAGLVPNSSKSFALGPFRETCGQDFHYGSDVRPTYLKANPVTEIDVYILSNSLILNRQGVDFPRTLEYLRGLVSRPCYQPFDHFLRNARYVLPEERSRVLGRGFFGTLEDVGPGAHHPDYQCKSWRLEGWALRPRYLAPREDNVGLLLSLWTGSHKPVDISIRAATVRKFTYTRWPSDGSWVRKGPARD